MSTKSASEARPRTSEHMAQETSLEGEHLQDPSLNTVGCDAVTNTRQETFLEHIDLLTSDAAKDDEQPPAYSNVYGEIHAEKDGLDTNASVTGDGRVNININQLNRRLSQIFTVPLDQHIKDAEDSYSIAAKIDSSHQVGEGESTPTPRLNIVIQVVGSRGDVQPFVALGRVLRDTYGHRVRLATHPIFKGFVQEHGLEFFSIGGDPSRLMAYMVKNPGLRPSFSSIASGDIGQRRRDVAEYIQGCWRSCYQAGDGIDSDDASQNVEGSSANSTSSMKPFVADCIIANPPSFAHIHCAQKLGIPLHIMFTMPYSPTQAFSHPLANIQSSNADPQLTNYISYAMIELLSWQALGDIINRFRTKCLGLDPVSRLRGPGTLQRLKIPHTYCWSPSLISKPKDWGAHIAVSGFFFLETSCYTPDGKLLEFLSEGPPPVYIGFGSIVLEDPNAMTELIFEAARHSGQRVLLSKGWGGMGAEELRVPDNVFMLGNVPHDWLFKQVSCVVHHGGAGTTSAGIAAGRPTVVVPFFGDQPFWGAMIARAGAGPDPIPHKQLTAETLADAIAFCLRPGTLERAKELASQISEEKGCVAGVRSFHQSLRPNRLCCALSPSRASVWRMRRTKIRLSAFAAWTLANANLLDFEDLKLFRAEEYLIDEGPTDPISGGFTSFLGAFTGMAMGLADAPSETWRAFKAPSERARQKAKASSSTSLSTAMTSQFQGSSTQPPTLESSPRTSFAGDSNAQKPGLFDRSNTMPVPSVPSQSSESQEVSIPKLPKRNSYGPDKQADMMRPTGIHVTKGAGRFVKALVQGPINISVNLTRGMHNVPKMWGDDTVRPQERVTDFRSGIKAVGREFGFGFYDGIGGVVMQPIKGAREGGATGFAKGLGKGIGGFVPKLGAACLGILSHTLQGVNKEVQKLFSSDVHSYIVASRVAQGYEEWMESSETEKEDIIVRWKIMRRALKGKEKIDDGKRKSEETRYGTAQGDERARTSSIVDVQRRSFAAENGLPSAQAANRVSYDSVCLSRSESNLNGEQHHTSRQEPVTPQQPPIPHQSRSLDQGHIAGTTLSDFETSQALGCQEKTAQEKTEEAIVLEYIKKQSLLEEQHRNRARDGAGETEVELEEERNLQRALQLSLQGAKG